MKINDKGSSQALLCLLLLLSLSGLTTITLKKVIILKKNRIRLGTLLCMRKSHYYQADFIHNIEKLNRLLKVAYYASKTPIPQVSAAAKASIVIFKSKQQFDLLNYYKKVYTVRECSKVTKLTLITNSFYKMTSKVIFKRAFDQTTTLNTASMKFLYSTSEKNAFTTLPIVFKSNFKVNNTIGTKLKIRTKVYEL